MGTGKFNAGGNPSMDYSVASHPGGNRNIPGRFMLLETGISSGLMSHKARIVYALRA